MNSDDRGLEWLQIKENVVFRNDFVGLRNDRVQRPDGEHTDFIVLETKDFSSTICVDENNQVILVRQFRYPWLMASWETASGLLEQGETPEECAIRETEEETGYIVKQIRPLLKYHPSGIGHGWCYLFFAKVEAGGTQSLDSNEFMKVDAFEPNLVDQLIRKGEIVHAPTLMGWYLMAKNEEWR